MTTKQLKKANTATVDLEGAAGSTWPNTADGYELQMQIGQGAFATVWQATCPKKETDVAIKIIDLDSLSSSLNDIYQETRVMRLSKDEHVLSSYACFVVKTNLWLVMPLMRKGSCLRIMRYLKACGLGEGLKEEFIAIILKSALEGLKYFHSQGQVHRDIKAGNLLMDSDGSVVISDFGVAAWVKTSGDRGGAERRTFVGTPCWMAPEVMEQADAYDEKADIWSLGITALELAKGYAPYARLNPMAVMIQTIREEPPSLKTYEQQGGIGAGLGAGNAGSLASSGPGNSGDEDNEKSKQKFSRHFKEIVTLCLQKNPKLRPSAATLLTKSFFTKAKDKSVLVRDLLNAVPIPDTKDTTQGPSRVVSGAVQAQQNGLGVPGIKTGQGQGLGVNSGYQEEACRTQEIHTSQVKKFLMQDTGAGGQSFLPGATWEFDTDMLAKTKQVNKQETVHEGDEGDEDEGPSIEEENGKMAMHSESNRNNNNALTSNPSAARMNEDDEIDFEAHYRAMALQGMEGTEQGTVVSDFSVDNNNQLKQKEPSSNSN